MDSGEPSTLVSQLLQLLVFALLFSCKLLREIIDHALKLSQSFCNLAHIILAWSDPVHC
jgi:hypothetical protein